MTAAPGAAVFSPVSSPALPLVSCVCATYNRPPWHLHLLEEAVESFLRQDYPNKELVILNDTAEQELVCEAPGVRIVNVAERFPTLGEKYNAAIELARGDLLAPWDDDDISLPWRLSASVALLGDRPYFNPRAYWFLDAGTLIADHRPGVAHNASLMTRDAFVSVGRYTARSVGYDEDINNAFWRQFPDGADPWRTGKRLPRAGWSYIYRWGVSPGHVSGGGEAFYHTIGERPILPGQYAIQPRWEVDYVALTRTMVDD